MQAGDDNSLMFRTCLKMPNDAPDQIKNNGRDTVSDAREVDPRQLHLRDKQIRCSQFPFRTAGLNRQNTSCVAGDTHMSVIQERQDLGNVI